MSNNEPTPSAPTVIYDFERSPSHPTLEPPNVDQLLESKKRRMTNPLNFSRSVQLPLTCFCIALSALQANGVYCWPTYGPVVARMLDFDGPEAQTIVVGGILGVYLMAAPLGALTDRLGPRVGSLLSGALAAVGYLTFALILKTQTPGTPYVHLYLTAAFAFVGAATVGSYFACLTTASLSFPNHPTLSLSLPLSLIGLSSLVLSSFSTLPIFTTPATPTQPSELDALKFIIFLGILSPSINLFSGVFMKVLPQPLSIDSSATIGDRDEEIPASPIEQLLHLDEHTPLLIGGPEAAREDVENMEAGKEVAWSVSRLVRSGGFWAFGLLLALCIGPAETIISSIGSVLTFLLPPTTLISRTTITTFLAFPTFTSLTDDVPNPLILRNKHVFILSLSSTFARLVTGVTADYLSPPLVAVPIKDTAIGPHSDLPEHVTHVFVRRRRVILARSAFTACCAAVLGGVFAWCAGMLESESGLWVLSGGVGLMYGAIFTLTPAIISAHYGATNFGLAWGMISYFPALGSVLFSYLYALLSVTVATESSDPYLQSLQTLKHESDNGMSQCYGAKCFRLTFWVAAGCCVVSAIGIAILGRRWKV